MEGILIKLGQFIFGLSILVSLHEFGHYITAKWCKMRVDRFYLFFDFLFPVPTLLNFALFKKKIGETEYGIGWFPLGGYVSIAGMIDETQDASKLSAEPQPWEFRGKPAWQRLIVMLGGVIVNVILGILIFWGLAFVYGNNYISKAELNKEGIFAGELGRKVGFQTGDKILFINGKDFRDYSNVSEAILEDKAVYTVERAGKQLEIIIPDNFLNELADNKSQFIQPLYKFKIGKVTTPQEPSFLDKLLGKTIAPKPAYLAGLQDGDELVSLNGKPVLYFQLFQEDLLKQADKNIQLAIRRQGKIDTLQMKVLPDGTIGFASEFLIAKAHEDYTLAQAFSVGVVDAFDVVWKNIQGFKKIFQGKVSASKALSGPFEIADMYGEHWSWFNFWNLTGLLSMALAFMNLLPIPALDGGHALFLLYEIITGRPPSEKVLERAQQVGTFILLGLMFFVIGNGLLKKIF